MNWDDIEIICGQDHFYWLYSNSRDKYICTPYRWKNMDEDDLKAKIDQNGIDNRTWRKELPFS